MRAKFKVGDIVLPTKKVPKDLTNLWPKKNNKFVPQIIKHVHYSESYRRSVYTISNMTDMYSYELRKAK